MQLDIELRAVTRRSVGLVMLAILAPACLIGVRPAAADWPAQGRAIIVAAKNQVHPRVATDGVDGAIVVWEDSRNPRLNVFARRVLASGDLDPTWPTGGLAVLADSATLLATAFGGQSSPVVVSDGSGGAIVAWQDRRAFESGTDIFAQHVLRSGVVDPAWPPNGCALCVVRGNQDHAAIASDGAGGAIVTWMDGRSGVTDVDIFAQHVLSAGVVDPAWPANGTALCAAPAPQDSPAIVADGGHGAIVTWSDFRASTTSPDIYAQRVLAAGTVDPRWPSNGRALTLAGNAQLNPTIESDGVNGAFVAWEDTRDGLSHIDAQRVLASGAIAAGWPADGLAVCTAPVDQVHPILTRDGSSGAIVAWQDARNGENHNPYVQHVLATGTVDAAWPLDGIALSLSSGEELDASIVADGSGGAIVAWEEDSFVLANHVQSSGLLDPTFPVNGRFVRLLLDFEHEPVLVGSGRGNAIVAWSDAVAQDFDLFATLVVTQEALAVDPGPASALALAPPAPNPARGPVTLSFSLPRKAAVRLAIYDVRGRAVRQLFSGTQAAGVHTVVWDQRDQDGRPVPAGVRFARLEVEGRALLGKVVTVR